MIADKYQIDEKVSRKKYLNRGINTSAAKARRKKLITPSHAKSELIKPRLAKSMPINTMLIKTTLMKLCHAKVMLIKIMLIKTTTKLIKLTTWCRCSFRAAML